MNSVALEIGKRATQNNIIFDEKPRYSYASLNKNVKKLEEEILELMNPDSNTLTLTTKSNHSATSSRDKDEITRLRSQTIND